MVRLGQASCAAAVVHPRPATWEAITGKAREMERRLILVSVKKEAPL
jgi:hypothetical protein